MNAIQGLGQRWTAYQLTKGLLVWAAGVGAVVAMVIGFAWGGWVTGGTARQLADSAATGSREQLVAAVCVNRFQAGSDAQAQLTELKGLQGWNRTTFIEKGGWAVMPDRTEASKAATTLCANQLVAL
jgi:hypothetical protein